MHSTPKEPHLSESVHHFKQNLIEISPETHGTLCGFLCAGLKTDGKAWLESLLATIDIEDLNNRPSRKTLIDLYNYILHQLIESRIELHPMISNHGEDLETRAEALSNWCYGFLLGLRQTGIDMSRSSIDDLQEIHYRISDIATIDYEHVDIRAEDETAFSEVLNYIHTSILYIYQEIAKKSKMQFH